MKNLEVFKKVKSYGVITFALLMSSLGWSAFIIPHEVVGGGITGLSSMLFYLFGIDVGLTSFSVNAVLILLSIRQLGYTFGLKTLYCITMFAIFMHFFIAYFEQRGPVVEDSFMSVLIGASLAGTGGGLIFINGGSSGGTDIIAMLINKYRNISIGKLILLLDVTIILSSYFIEHDIEMVMYGFITMAVFSYAVDLVIAGNKSTVQFFIISNKYKELSQEIIHNACKGVTILDGVGGYTGEQKKVLMVISRKRTSSVLLRIIKEVDPDAFITMGSVTGVYGQGFDQIKV